MKILDGEVLPDDSLVVDADLRRGQMTFERLSVPQARK
jgi:hypothetical protein